MIDKLSPELRVHLRAPRARRTTAAAVAAPAPSEPARTEILVEFNGRIEDLVAVGFRPRSVLTHPVEGYTIATGILPVDRLTDLAAIDHVVEVEGPQQYSTHLNYSLPTIHADAVQSGTPSRTGRGVIVGVIDTGIDWRHGAFIDPGTGKSRILSLWDQWLDADVGETVGPTVEGEPLGVIYSQKELSDAIEAGEGTPPLKIRSMDRRGHGTHVAGIAAGNGGPGSCCHFGGTYVGVGPNAHIVIVKLWNDDRELGENIRLVDAITFILDLARTGVPPAVPAGLPVAINMSLGQDRGPHDGTAMVERAINTAVAAPGRAIVVAAGNEADEFRHVRSTVPKRSGDGPGEREFEFTVPERCEKEQWLDIWYERAGTLHLEFESPDGESTGQLDQGSDPPPFTANPDVPDEDQECTVDITSRINNPHSRDNNWRIHIDTPASGNIPHGSWTVRLINPTNSDISFHAWLEGRKPHAKFLDPANESPDEVTASKDSTITIPGTAAGAITVANHANKTDCCNCHVLTGIVKSSSHGPVARGAATNRKPDMAAPGLEITSVKKDPSNGPGHCCSCCPNFCCELYVDMTGTSMATAHVAGTIALMLEENPQLTKAQILQFLQTSASPAPSGGSPNVWGAGKLNAQKAVEAVRVAGGGGGGGHPHFTLPLHGGGAPACHPGLHPALRLMRDRLMMQPEGIALLAAVSRHFSEVRRLINTNRRVATMWHRASGPRRLRELLSRSITPDAPTSSPPPWADDYLERWCDLLAQYGSARLRAGLDRYRCLMIDLLRAPAGIDSPMDLEAMAAL